ncbi:MAG TPA: hypothetical protein DEQ09_11875 [Bacteroidales bacterium]|nr:hypothetical protein [Bacteroidales bacterium]
MLSLLSITSEGQTITDPDDMKKMIEKEIEIDYSDADTIVPLFTIEHNGNTSVLSKETTKTVRFTFTVGYNLRFYLIGSSSANSDLVLRLHKYNEEDDVASDLYFELRDNKSDIQVSKHDYVIRSNTENILLLIIPEDYKGSAVAVVTEFWKK